MWIVNFLPSWFFYFLVIAGIAGIVASQFLKMIPFVGANAMAVRIGSVAVLLLGTWFWGAASNNAAWEARVKEMEAKVAEAAAKSQEENKQIETKTVVKTQIIKVRGENIIKYVDNEVVKYNDQCKIPKEFIEAHNRAAEQPK